MLNIARDARIGARLLWKSRGFATVAVLTLAIGIAANTAIFSVIYATFFEPLPYRDAERLVMVWAQFEGERQPVSPADFLAWKREATALEDLQAWTGDSVNLAGDDRPEQVNVGPATPGFLAMLGYGHPLAFGRTFAEEEGTLGPHRVAILTHRLWRERFGADPGIVGREVRIDNEPYTVVGVLGPGPADLNQHQMWLPLGLPPELWADHGARFLTVMGRLKPGVTVEEANAQMATITRRLAAEHPNSNKGWSASVEPFRNNFLSDNTKRGLWLLLGAVGFLLLIACSNVANLLLARGTTRRRELAVRASLGASTADIVRQLLTEGVVLALVGGGLGIALASGLLSIVIALMPPYFLPTEANIRLNVPVLLFTLIACTLSGILSGLAPAWQAARTSPHETLKEGARTLSGGGNALRRVLVGVEFALALTLLTAGGLAVHSLYALTSAQLGFRTEGLLTFVVPMKATPLTTTEQVTGFYRNLLARIESEPGVIGAAVSTGLPLRGGFRLPFAVESRPPGDPSQRPSARYHAVSPTYFDALDIRIIRGRAFTDRDRDGSVPVAIVNETFVRRFLGGEDPLTQSLVIGKPLPGADDWPDVAWRIVGVAEDVRSAGAKNDKQPEIHVPFLQSPWPSLFVAIRTAAVPTTLQSRMASLVQSIDPTLPIADVKTMEQRVVESLTDDRFNTALFGGFALIGLLMAALGIYGVMSFVVAQRTHEIGLRMALGADRSQVIGDVLREGMVTAAIGTVAGAVGAIATAQAMRGMIPGVAGSDPTTFIVVAAVLLGSALLACVAPARRAASVDPMVALREV
jgi:putative ABC transport system permease protein